MLPEGEGRTRMLADLDEMEAMVSSTLEFARGEESDEPVLTIDLAATLESICDNATVLACRQGGDIRVVIEDNGPGIPEDCREKVFTPFFRLEQSRSRKTGGGGLRAVVTLPQAGTGE